MSSVELETPQDYVHLHSFSYMELYLVTGKNGFEQIEATGESIYYALCNGKIPTETAHGTTTFSKEPRLYRVEKSVMGRAVFLADPSELEMVHEIKEHATFDLPQIPWKLLKEVDMFFRHIHTKLGTESIVILTFDPAKLGTENPSDGWGVLIPDQSNTSGHCDYDPPSVMARKPEGVDIVGTIHSHPNMSAFASGTDHHDQLNWDGLHITYGWRSGGPTEYHIEVVMGGKTWNYTEADLFAPIPTPSLDAAFLEEWEKPVAKKVTTSTTSTHGQGMGHGGPSKFATPVPPNGYNAKRKVRAIQLPADAPNPTENVLVAVLDLAKANACPFCKMPLGPQSIGQRRCIACRSFFRDEEETIADILQVRAEQGRPTRLDLDVEASPYPIIEWIPAAGPTLPDEFSEDRRTLAPKA